MSVMPSRRISISFMAQRTRPPPFCDRAAGIGGRTDGPVRGPRRRTGPGFLDHVLVRLMLLSWVRDAPPAQSTHSQRVTGARRGILAVLAPRALRLATL